MRHHSKHWKRMIIPLLILSWLNINGCVSKSHERLATLETTQCDPFTRQDCWSVSEQFVRERFTLEEQLIRTKDALKTCREKL